MLDAHADTLSALVTAAGARWAVEETFQIGKGQVGLDHYQCRTWTAWHRHTVLAMAALAILVAITTIEPPPSPGLAALSVPEARRLLTILTTAKLVADDRLRRYVQDKLAGVVRGADGRVVAGPSGPQWKGRNKPHRGNRAG